MDTSATQFALPLQGKLAIVTGASRGIGAGLAYELARRGANVCMTYLSDSSKPAIDDLRTKITQLPHAPTTWACQTDLSSPTGASQIITHLKTQLHPTPLKIDILINNAGIEIVNPIQDTTLDDYDKVFNLNVRGTMLMTQAVIPYLPPKGRIINLSSVGARYGFKNISLYIASKAAIEGFTRAWAAELGANGTTVNAVAPGPVPSDLLDRIPKEIVELQMATTPIEQRLGTTGEVANIVAWLAGPDASWVTGQVICASGGWVMY
ncbi:SDR family NAD(P)-dependent oxidoreductase [Aspergillus ibericus CBS 121593]|uniref:Dehydrogenase n=1 Tax=Aspergillus ibericus CBS 121593 TaxID=1448316 RepID=A0A395GRE4_9EURO|nr:dehydrogenase [Aspergillus ibericus CBS 121593]RAK97942.1 dehydrogenase [Aspergillus ibericus CBS 121593]